LERIERGLVAYGWAGKPGAGRRRALQRSRGSKTFTAFRPALGHEGRAEKLLKEAESATPENRLSLEVVN
jgi:hypothetical protein